MNLYRLDASARAVAAAFDADAGEDPCGGGLCRAGSPRTRHRERQSRRKAPFSAPPKLWGVPPRRRGRSLSPPSAMSTSPFWIGTLRHAELRCLIPATSFAYLVGNRRRAKRQRWASVPVAARSSPSRVSSDRFEDWPGFAVAHDRRRTGLIERHREPHVMPLILHPEDQERWLTAEWRDAVAARRRLSQPPR
jgi:hypothetical protein